VPLVFSAGADAVLSVGGSRSVGRSAGSPVLARDGAGRGIGEDVGNTLDDIDRNLFVVGLNFPEPLFSSVINFLIGFRMDPPRSLVIDGEPTWLALGNPIDTARPRRVTVRSSTSSSTTTWTWCALA
jgi:hypothetical protein